MKIAFLVGKFPSLSETFILNQITGLIDAGHEVDIYALNHPFEETVQPEVDQYRLLDRTTYIDIPDNKARRALNVLGLLAANLTRRFPKNALALLDTFNPLKYGRQALSLRLFYILEPILNHGPYDILHCHFGNVGKSGALIKKARVPGKLVVTFHGQDISRYLNKNGSHIYDDIFQQADLLMPVSEHWKEKLIQMGADIGRIRVHRMGIDMDRFPYKARSMGPACEEVRLLTVGRLVEKKGIDIAIRAVADLFHRHPDWKVRYHIIGEGEERSRLEDLIHALGVEDRVRLLGPAAANVVREHMLNAHLFLLPSRTDREGDQEGIPVSIMEAQATGMPVLSTRHTGVPELVEDGSSGYLVAEGDVEGLTGALEDLIRNPQRWPEMGRQGRRRIEEGYEINTLNNKLVDTYKTLVEAPDTPPRRARRREKPQKNAFDALTKPVRKNVREK